MMKSIKWMALFWLLGMQTVLAADYALIKRYALLNDMKTAQKQQKEIFKLQELLTAEHIDSEELNRVQEDFNRGLLGLMHGDIQLHLKGTTLPSIRTKLDKVYQTWQENEMLLNQSETTPLYREKNLANLNLLLSVMSQAVMAYSNSYERYRQSSYLSAIVKNYSYQAQQRLALNRKINLRNTTANN